MIARHYYMLCLLLAHACLLSNEQFTTHSYTNDFHAANYILCASVSGPLVAFGVFATDNATPTLTLLLESKNQNIDNFTDVVCDVLSYLKDTYTISIKHACIAGPGVPSAQQDYLTHCRLSYAIDAQDIIQKTDLTTAIIINDFFAASYGIDSIDKKNIIPLYDTTPEIHGRRAVIGSGNGLGSAVMIWNESKQSYHSFPAEAGSLDFPAQNQFEFDLATNMKQLLSRNTLHWTNFTSLSGLQNTYLLLKSMNLYHDSLNTNDINGITILSHETDELCKAATTLFFTFYARFAHNFIWTSLPFGGLYIIGKVSTDYTALFSELFLPEYFNCVPIWQPVLKRIPIYLIHDDAHLDLYGAAHYLMVEKK